MRVLNWLGMERLAWSLRRLHCPVPPDALVLEVGSGGNPYPRSNVLLDAYEETRERHWVPLVIDRPFILGFCEQLPFKTAAFDFLIASHVLEHSHDPEKTLAEFQRVARAGYIEVPDAFLERINPYKDHRLEITLRNGILQIRKKANWIVDAKLVELYEDRVKLLLTKDLMPRRPFDFHVRYYWSGQIKYQIHNAEVDLSWIPPSDGLIKVLQTSRPKKGELRDKLVTLTRKLFSQTSRNRLINVIPLLRCPACASLSEKELVSREGMLLCEQCAMVYPVKNGVPIMYPR
jgi:uncharacterized protein YbaR (Trm112 family)/SAM-dependent methyltransferase